MIFIRLVNDGDNGLSRFEKAFKDVSIRKWRTFSNAQELPSKLFQEKEPIIHPTAINHRRIDRTTENKAMNLSMIFSYHILSILILTMLNI